MVKADQIRMYFLGTQRVTVNSRKGDRVQVCWHHPYEGRVIRWVDIREIRVETVDI